MRQVGPVMVRGPGGSQAGNHLGEPFLKQLRLVEGSSAP